MIRAHGREAPTGQNDAGNSAGRASGAELARVRDSIMQCECEAIGFRLDLLEQRSSRRAPIFPGDQFLRGHLVFAVQQGHPGPDLLDLGTVDIEGDHGDPVSAGECTISSNVRGERERSVHGQLARGDPPGPSIFRDQGHRPFGDRLASVGELPEAGYAGRSRRPDRSLSAGGQGSIQAQVRIGRNIEIPPTSSGE